MPKLHFTIHSQWLISVNKKSESISFCHLSICGTNSKNLTKARSEVDCIKCIKSMDKYLYGGSGHNSQLKNEVDND